jgi:hypothetical protein
VCSELDFVVTHELAHAWESVTLDEDDRDRYLALRGLSTWDDHSVAWGQRGEEDAAFIVQQNLMSSSCSSSPTWVERTEAYEALTGRPSPLRDCADHG